MGRTVSGRKKKAQTALSIRQAAKKIQVPQPIARKISGVALL